MIVLKELSELVQACKDVKERMTPDNHMIHVDDIGATLQTIIDDEFARANRTFDQVAIEEVIAAHNPPDPKTFRWEVTQAGIDAEANRLEMTKPIIRILLSPYEWDVDLPWEYTQTQFISWVSEVFLESYKKDIVYPSMSEAIKIVEENQYKLETIWPSQSPNNDEEAKPIKVPALPRRRRERSRRAGRLNQSRKTNKGNA